MVHLPIPQQVSALSQQGADAQGGTVREGAPRVLNTDSSREGDTAGALRTSGERRERHRSKHSSSQPLLEGQSLSRDHCHQLPQGPKEGQQWNQQSEPTSCRKSREKRESRAFPRDRERGE